jgi:hypothetical protein
VSIYGHNPIMRRPDAVRDVDDTPGPWLVRARQSGVHAGDGSIIVTCGDRSTAIARAMDATHGDRHGAVTAYNQVTIRHADDTTPAGRWSATWTAGGVWHEHGPLTDRGWTLAGEHTHARRMAAFEPPEQDTPAPGAWPGHRPVVAAAGRRWLLVHESGGCFSFLRPDGTRGYATPADPRDPGQLAAAVTAALAEPTPACPECGAGPGEYCRPVPDPAMPPFTAVRVDQVPDRVTVLGTVDHAGNVRALAAGRGPYTGLTRVLARRRAAAGGWWRLTFADAWEIEHLGFELLAVTDQAPAQDATDITDPWGAVL